MEYLNAEKNWLSVDSGGADILGIYDINYRQPTRKTFVVSVSSVGDLSFKYFTYSTTNSALMKISNVRTGEFKTLEPELKLAGYRIVFKNKIKNFNIVVFVDENGYRPDYTKR